MKAIVNTSAINKELKRMSQVINKNTILPILSCVKLNFEKDSLTISASDLETTIVSTIGCECNKPFTVIVEQKDLADIFSKLSDCPVTIEENKTAVMIYENESKWKLPKGGEETEFPKIPDEEFIFSVDVEEDFFTALFSADTCKHSDVSQVRLNTACLDFKKDVLTIVGTDAFVMYKKDLKIKTDQKVQSLPRGRFVQAVKSFRTGKLSIGKKFAKVESENTSIITTLQDNKYCDYSLVIPEKIDYNITVDRVEFNRSLEKLACTSNPATKLVGLYFESGKIRIRSSDVAFSKEGETVINAIYSGEIEPIGVKSVQLSHIFSLMDSDEVKLSITNPNKSIYIQQVGDNSLTCLIQPILLD